MAPKVYIETSVLGYLVARRNQRNLMVAANQELTHEWWERRRTSFELYVSAIVLAEAARGDEVAAAARMAIARELKVAETSPKAVDLADALISGAGCRRVPMKMRFTSRLRQPAGWTTCSPGIASTLRTL